MTHPSDLPRAAPSLEDPPVGPRDAGIYVHFPYCAEKCPYCDFNSHVLPHDDRRYADAILAELDHRAEHLEAPADGLASVYFGGGTPSRWAPEEVGRVLAAIRARFGLAPGAEVTLEANPGTLVEGRLEGFRRSGINRFSIGCQSFDDLELRTLGRIHDAEAGRRAVRMARGTGARVSLDLIYGLPGQSAASAFRSVDEALQLEPDHVSAYTLSIEPNTVLARRTRLGLFRPMPDDEQADLIEHVSARLERAGFARYEVSSYARAGRVSIHNTLYWLGGAYLGLGAGAHSYLPHRPPGASGPRSAIRRENERSPERYLAAALGGRTEAQFEERLDPRGLVADRLMVVFRTAFGLDPGALVSETGAWLGQDVLSGALLTLERQGLVKQAGRRVAPTARGFLFNDAIARAMLDLVGSIDHHGIPT